MAGIQQHLWKHLATGFSHCTSHIETENNRVQSEHFNYVVLLRPLGVIGISMENMPKNQILKKKPFWWSYCNSETINDIAKVSILKWPQNLICVARSPVSCILKIVNNTYFACIFQNFGKGSNPTKNHWIFDHGHTYPRTGHLCSK